MEVDMMQEFPLLSSWQDHKYWTGFLTSQSLLVRLAIKVPHFPSSKGVVLQGDAETVTILKPCWERIQSTIDAKASVVVVLREVRGIIEEQVKKIEDPLTTSALGTNDTEFYTTLFSELEQLGPQNVDTVSSSFDELAIKCLDQKKRRHILRFHVPPQYPKVPVKVFAELPCPQKSYNWPDKLLDVYNQFKIEVEKYSPFWDMLDELDNQARVIDPIQPNRSDVHRRILMNQNVLVSLVFNPSCPRATPQIKFSGPEQAVEDLDVLLDRDCKNWSDCKSILENLEEILQCEFMPKQDPDASVAEDEPETTCVICYAFEFEGKIPETNCECGSVYHERCLGDLLVNDCSVKAMRLCVDCPVCGLELKVSNAKQTSW